MGFSEDIRGLAERIEKMESRNLSEEATKMSLIVPFFQILGYDVFNPQEFCPEYTADVGIKKGEKVDYAISINNHPVILIEAKAVNKKLDKYSSQLFRYFVTTSARFAILTNGIVYQFYSDLDEPNKMDKDPFMEVNLLDIKDNQISQIEKFHKKYLNVEEILDTASILKYNTLFKKFISQQISEPSNDFVKLFLQPFYKGTKTQAVIEKFKPILSNAFTEYINETVNAKIKFALDNVSIGADEKPVAKEEEWNVLALIKDILKTTIRSEDICHKQTESYLAILYTNNTRKWICRVYLNYAQKYITLPDENKKEIKYYITDIQDIANYADEIVSAAMRYLQPDKKVEYLHTKWGTYEMPDPYKIRLERGPRDDLKEVK